MLILDKLFIENIIIGEINSFILPDDLTESDDIFNQPHRFGCHSMLLAFISSF